MILREATIKYSGRDPDELVKGSHKRICVSCDSCGRVRWVSKSRYKDLCGSCAKSGKRNSMFGIKGKNHHNFNKSMSDEQKIKISNSLINHKVSNETKKKMSESRLCENNPNWKGGFNTKRSWILPESQCIKLNKKFNNSEFHHLNKSIGVYIPKELHRHIWHNMKSGQDMESINKVALQYLIGDYYG